MEKTLIEGLSGSSIMQIGLGRLGVHLNRHLNSFFDEPVVVYNPVCNSSENFKKAIKENQIKYIFLSVPDNQIEHYIEQVPEGEKVIHFSGFYYDRRSLGLHPVQSFSKEGSYNFDEIDFVADGEADCFLKEIFKKVHLIDPELKKTYHTYLSVTANSLQLTLNQLGEVFTEKTNLPSDLLKKITIQSLEREFKFGAESFSGPWTRNEDSKQIEYVEKINDVNLQELNTYFQGLIGRYRDEHTEV